MSINFASNGGDSGMGCEISECPGAPKLEPMSSTNLQVEALFLEEPSIQDLKVLINEVLNNYESINLGSTIQAAAICMQNKIKQYYALCIFELLLHKNVGFAEAIAAAQKAKEQLTTHEGGLKLIQIIKKCLD